MVEQTSGEGNVATLEIPYTPLQISVSSNPVVSLIIPNLVAPLVIILLSPFHFESTKVFPWNYNPVVYIHGTKQEDPSTTNESTVNIAGTRGMPRSGCVFAFTPLPNKDNVEAVAKSKGK